EIIDSESLIVAPQRWIGARWNERRCHLWKCHAHRNFLVWRQGQIANVALFLELGDLGDGRAGDHHQCVKSACAKLRREISPASRDERRVDAERLEHEWGIDAA